MAAFVNPWEEVPSHPHWMSLHERSCTCSFLQMPLEGDHPESCPPRGVRTQHTRHSRINLALLFNIICCHRVHSSFILVMLVVPDNWKRAWHQITCLLSGVDSSIHVPLSSASTALSTQTPLPCATNTPSGATFLKLAQDSSMIFSRGVPVPTSFTT